MTDDLVDRALNRPKGRQHVSDNTDQKARYAPVDESEWGWAIEVFEKGSWKIIFGPVFREADVQTKIPKDSNNYRIHGSAELGRVLRQAIKKQEEEAKDRKSVV